MRPILVFFFIFTAFAIIDGEDAQETDNHNHFWDTLMEKISCIDYKLRFLPNPEFLSDQIMNLDSRLFQIENEIQSSSSETSQKPSSSVPPSPCSSGTRFSGLPEADPSTLSSLSALFPKVVKLEKELTELKYKFSTPENESHGNLSSEIETLKKSLKQVEKRIKTIELSVDDNHSNLLRRDEEGALDNACNPEEYGLSKFRNRSIFHYLQRIDFNIFHNKPTKTSSVFDQNWIAAYGIDGDFTTRYSTKYENNPWLVLDLKVPHLIWQITFTTYAADRMTGINIYMTDKLTYDYYERPEVKGLRLFATFSGGVKSLVAQFSHRGGMCGRYVVVVRELNGVDLSFFELQAVGLPLM